MKINKLYYFSYTLFSNLIVKLLFKAEIYSKDKNSICARQLIDKYQTGQND